MKRINRLCFDNLSFPIVYPIAAINHIMRGCAIQLKRKAIKQSRDGIVHYTIPALLGAQCAEAMKPLRIICSNTAKQDAVGTVTYGWNWGISSLVYTHRHAQYSAGRMVCPA